MNRFFNQFYHATGIITDSSQRSVASRVSSLMVQGIIAFSLMGTLGIDTTPLVTAAGVTGATIGFACRDFGSNFVASIALAGQQSLRTGNRIAIGTGPTAVRGEVVDWDMRYLYLRSADKNLLHIPNNMVLTSVVTWETDEKRQEMQVNTPQENPTSITNSSCAKGNKN